MFAKLTGCGWLGTPQAHTGSFAGWVTFLPVRTSVSHLAHCSECNDHKSR